MQITANIGNSNFWELVWSGTIKSQSLPNKPDRYYPIGTITIPLLIESPILAVYSSSATARSYWVLGAWMKQKIRSGLTIGGNTDAILEERYKVLLNKINLFVLSQLRVEYSLSFDIPYWHEDISLSIWKFVGPVYDPTQKLFETLKIDLLRIEGKIDSNI